MIISDSFITLQSTHEYQEELKTSEKLTLWQTGRPSPAIVEKGLRDRIEKGQVSHAVADQVALSKAGKIRARLVTGQAEPVPAEEIPLADLKMRILKALIERLTGKKIILEDPSHFYDDQSASASQAPEAVVDTATREQEGSVGWGMIYEYHESYQEQEKTTFSAEGTILTGDGRSIAFSAQLNMERSFFSEQNLSIRAGDALKDPLVINFSGTAAELTDTTFSFDLDRDGSEDQVRFVAPDSGFLTLDHNGDGLVNDGGELFGPISGDGFADLKAYDQDGNDWIDENDAVYDRLRIWTRDDDGRFHLFGLGEKGVGAVYLGHITTPFDIKDSANALLGQVRSSSVFLNEDGRVGTVQQIDLVV